MLGNPRLVASLGRAVPVVGAGGDEDRVVVLLGGALADGELLGPEDGRLDRREGRAERAVVGVAAAVDVDEERRRDAAVFEGFQEQGCLAE